MKYCECEVCGKKIWMRPNSFKSGYFTYPDNNNWLEDELGDFCPRCRESFLEGCKQLIVDLKKKYEESNN